MQNSIITCNSDFLNDDAVFKFHYDQMSQQRKSKIDKLNIRESKNASLLAGILLNKLIEANNFSDYQIVQSDNGKPYEKNNKFFFSISHSKSMVAVAISDIPVGIDLEMNSRQEKKNIIKRFFNEDDMNKPFLEVWTQKESYTKLKDLNLIDVLKNPIDNNVCFQTSISKTYTLSICTEVETEFTITVENGESYV